MTSTSTFKDDPDKMFEPLGLNHYYSSRIIGDCGNGVDEDE
jgi:hypothetical protein